MQRTWVWRAPFAFDPTGKGILLVAATNPE